MPALAHQGGDRQHQGRVPAGGGNRTDPALKSRHPLFQHRGGRVRDPGIDVTRALQIEQGCRVLGIRKHIGGGLVDRDRPGAGGRVRLLARMQCQGVESEDVSVGCVGGFGRGFRGTHRDLSSVAVATNRPVETMCCPSGGPHFGTERGGRHSTGQRVHDLGQYSGQYPVGSSVPKRLRGRVLSRPRPFFNPVSSPLNLLVSAS